MIRIEFTRETSHHDGYCSGEECEYNITKQDTECIIANGLVNEAFGEYKIGDELPLEEIKHHYENMISTKFDLPEIDDCFQSGYCKNSAESNEHGMQKHDIRITITKATKIK